MYKYVEVVQAKEGKAVMPALDFKNAHLGEEGWDDPHPDADPDEFFSLKNSQDDLTEDDGFAL